jgi:hypothetical protein
MNNDTFHKNIEDLKDLNLKIQLIHIQIQCFKENFAQKNNFFKCFKQFAYNAMEKYENNAGFPQSFKLSADISQLFTVFK